MPYAIVRKGSGYVVRNMKTGKEYSNHPMPRNRAEAQLRLLRMVG